MLRPITDLEQKTAKKSLGRFFLISIFFQAGIFDLFCHFPFDDQPCFVNNFWTDEARMMGIGSFERSFQELSKRHQIYVNSSRINRIMIHDGEVVTDFT